MEYFEDAREDTVRLKKIVRKKILAWRDSIPAADKTEYDAKIGETITSMKEYHEAEIILAYVSYRSEVDTLMLIEQAWADGKSVFAPKVSGNEMEFWRITSMEELQEGYRGIREPVQSVSFSDWIKENCNTADINTVTDKAENCEQKACKVMIWMPGAAFDMKRHRIGYGGGFYDRYLNRLAQLLRQTASAEQQGQHFDPFTLTTAALAYYCQVLEQIPYEEHDAQPDFLITEQGIYH